MSRPARRHVLGLVAGAALEASGLGILAGAARPARAATAAMSKNSQAAAVDNTNLVWAAYAGRDLTQRLSQFRDEKQQAKWKRMTAYDQWSRERAIQVALFRIALWVDDLPAARASLDAMTLYTDELRPDAPFWERPEAIDVTRLSLLARNVPRQPSPESIALLLRIGRDDQQPLGLRFDALHTLYVFQHPSARLSEERSLILEMMDVATDSRFAWDPQIAISYSVASRFYTRVGAFDRAVTFAQWAFYSCRLVSAIPTLASIDATLAAAEFFVARIYEQRREEADDTELSQQSIKSLTDVLSSIDIALSSIPVISPATRLRIDLARLASKLVPSLPWMSRILDMVVDGPWKTDAAVVSEKLEALAAKAKAQGLGYEQARCHHLLYRASIVIGDDDRASAESGRALEIARASLDTSDIRLLEFLNHRVIALAGNGANRDEKEIERISEETGSLIEAAITDYFRGSTFLEKANFATGAGVQLYLSIIFAASISDPRHQYDLVLKIKGRLHQAVRAECEALRTKASADLRRELREQSDYVVKRIYSSDTGQIMGGAVEGSWEGHFHFDRAWRQLSDLGHSSTLAQKAHTLAEIQHSLGPDEVVIDIVRSDIPRRHDSLMAYVYGPTGEPRRVSLGETDLSGKFAAVLRSLLRDTSDQEKREQFDDTSWFLIKTFWWPLEAAIEEVNKKASLIYIVPTREFAAFPFSSLISAKGEYIGERLSFAFLFSPYDLLRPPITHAVKGKALLIGNVDYGKTSAFSRASLDRNSKAAANLSLVALNTAEVESIQKIYNSKQPSLTVEVLEGSDVRESEFSKQVPSSRILHLSTHGFIRTVSSMLNVLPSGKGIYYTNGSRVRPDAEVSPFISYGVGMSGANVRDDDSESSDWRKDGDGILTAIEIMQQNLDSCELVVLSACDGAIGEYYSNEVMIGLAPAFDYAGARSVIATLTPVNTVATSHFVTYLHENLADGLPPARALTAAVKALRATKVAGFSLDSPMYWAPFVVFGRQRPLFES